jgi:hypothetical protein
MSGRINIPWQQFTVLFMRIYRPESQASRFLAEPYGMEEEEYVATSHSQREPKCMTAAGVPPRLRIRCDRNHCGA